MSTTLTRINPPVAGAVTVALAAVFMAFAYFGGSDAEDNSAGEYLICLAIIAVSAAAAFGWALPRATRTSALVMSLLAVLTLVVYWIGLPLVLGGAAVVAGRQTGAAVPQVLGGLAFLVAAVASVAGF